MSDQTLHILYLCNEYPPCLHGGIGTFVQTMARQMVKKGHRSSVVGFSPVDEFRQEDDMGVNVFRFPLNTGSRQELVHKYTKLARLIHDIHSNFPIDLVEGTELSFGSLPGSLPGKKVIRIHGGYHFFSKMLGLPQRLSTSLIERRSFAQADYFCAVSRFAAEETRQLLRTRARAIEIIPNPVDTVLFRPYPDIQEQDGLIVFTGGLREKKGVRQLIQAMPMVIEKHPQARLWIQGADIMDRRTGRSFLETLKNEVPPAISAKIEFRGPIPHHELPKINAMASLLVFPSWMETQGIVVIEGMASGKAVIASQTGPGPELITDGQDGLLCDPYSPNSIAEKILLLLEDPALRQELSIHARKKVESVFSIDVLVKKNLEFYQSCMGSHEDRS